MGKTSLRMSGLYIRNGKLDTKWRSRKTKSRKENSRTALSQLDGYFVTLKQDSPHVFFFPGMLYVYKSDPSVAISTLDDLCMYVGFLVASSLSSSLF